MSEKVTQTISQKRESELEKNLQYLRLHGVCEQLEEIVKALLISRPQDPILAICNFLYNTTSNQRSDEKREEGISRTQTPSSGGPCSRVPTPSAGRLPHRRDSSGTTSKKPLERDESARSDMSTFSLTSVDMCDFLAEFRAAHFGLYGAEHALISKTDLGEIVDHVALAIPDTKMISDLFDEIDHDNDGKVLFNAFLARLNFKIQGKYNFDVIRNVFFSLLSKPPIVSAASRNHSPTPKFGQKPTPREMNPTSKKVVQVASSTNDMASLDESVMSHEGDTEGLRNAECLDGLRKGFGMQISDVEYAKILQALELPSSWDHILHVEDFVRVVYAISGQTADQQ